MFKFFRRLWPKKEQELKPIPWKRTLEERQDDFSRRRLIAFCEIAMREMHAEHPRPVDELMAEASIEAAKQIRDAQS